MVRDFDFPSPELRSIHEKWLKEQLIGVSIAKVKDLEGIHKGLGLPAGPKTIGVRATRAGVPLSASIVVESVHESSYKLLRQHYGETEAFPGERGIKHLLIFRWTVKDGGIVHCILEYWKYNKMTGSLVRTKERLGILPSENGYEIKIPKGDLTNNAEENEVVGLDVRVLRNEIRDLIRTFCKAQGYSPAGIEDNIPRKQEKAVPTTREEFETALGNLTQILGLDALYGEEELHQFAEKAARNIEGALTDFELPKSAVMSLTKVNLFRTIIFCDDSGSMAGSLYSNVQKEAVLKLAPLATRLNEDGVSLRFINFTGDGRWDNLRANDDINGLRAKYESVRPSGPTPLGHSLAHKVVTPLLNSLEGAQSIQPLLVSIITDGEAQDQDYLEATIQKCKRVLTEKRLLNHQSLGHSAVIFQIHFVGSDPDASDFISRLDRNLGEFIFCNKKRFDHHVLDPSFNDSKKYQLLLDVASSAIDRVIAIRQANRTGTQKWIPTTVSDGYKPPYVAISSQ